MEKLPEVDAVGKERGTMDLETERRLKKKIMAGEELTEEEKKYFENYDQWKVQHDQARAATIEGLRWNAWPALFICAFFLLNTAFQNFRYLQAVSWQAEASVYLVTILSVVLGIAGAVGAFWMKGKAASIAKKAREAEGLILSDATEAKKPEIMQSDAIEEKKPEIMQSDATEAEKPEIMQSDAIEEKNPEIMQSDATETDDPE